MNSKLYGGVLGGKRNKWLNFGGNPDHHADSPVGHSTITEQIMNRLWWNFQDISVNNRPIKNYCLNFSVDLNHHADSPNCESGKYGGNELPCRRSTLLECFCYDCTWLGPYWLCEGQEIIVHYLDTMGLNTSWVGTQTKHYLHWFSIKGSKVNCLCLFAELFHDDCSSLVIVNCYIMMSEKQINLYSVTLPTGWAIYQFCESFEMLSWHDIRAYNLLRIKVLIFNVFKMHRK